MFQLRTWKDKYLDSNNLRISNDLFGVFESYIYAFYWSITTMTSCGYGDITPANGFEATYVSFTMLLTCGIFAYTFNGIGLIVEDYNK
jgi:hypothetical protein